MSLYYKGIKQGFLMNFSKKIVTALAISSVATPALFAATAYQNQIGFLTKGPKQLVLLDGAGQEVTIKDSENNTVLTVTAPEAKTWIPAGEDVPSLIDFSKIDKAGTYQAYIGDEKIGHPIVIADNALEDAAKASLKFFYFQRASTALDEKYAGKWARAAGHPDTLVKYHESTGHTDPNEFGSAPKGWYDAGDYGKYIVNSGISTYTLLQLYQQNKEYFSKLSLNIPESENKVPDILDEIRWNLEWMLKMQDTDGGVFHKLTTKGFAGTVMPEKTTAQRFFIGKAAEATWNFAAVMTLAAEIYKPFDEEFSNKCIKAAGRAYAWGSQNKNQLYTQPAGVSTGAYTNAADWTTRLWALIEMYRVSGQEDILNELKEWPISQKKASLQSWQNNYMLGIFSLATNPDRFEKDMVDTAKSIIISMADGYLNPALENGYGLPLINGDFNWGSNGTIANKGMVLIHAYILTKEQKYLDAANSIADYILGRNPLDISYLTGFGVKQVMHPHHRPSEADGIEAPVPGMIAGGANRNPTDCAASAKVEGAAAKTYLDAHCSYATNEVAINWNAPFAYLVGSLQAIASTGKSYDVKTKIQAKLPVNIKPEDETSIPFSFDKSKTGTITEGRKLIIRGNSIQVQYTDAFGNKKYFNLNGKTVK